MNEEGEGDRVRNGEDDSGADDGVAMWIILLGGWRDDFRVSVGCESEEGMREEVFGVGGR